MSTVLFSFLLTQTLPIAFSIDNSTSTKNTERAEGGDHSFWIFKDCQFPESRSLYIFKINVHE